MSPADQGASDSAAAPEPVVETPEPVVETPEPVVETPEPVVEPPAPEKAPEVAPAPVSQSVEVEQPEPQAPSEPEPAAESASAPVNPSLPPVEVGGSVSGSVDGQAGGGFRETLWFMQAQDPDSLEAIQNDDHNLESLNESYEDDGNALDTQVRQKFSLNISGATAAVPTATGQTSAPSNDVGPDGDDVQSPSDNKSTIIAAIAVAILVIAGVFFML